MPSVNKVILVGNLGRDPETRYSPEGAAMTNVSIATTDRWKDKTTGEDKDQTEWHRVVFFNRLAEIAAEYLKKGRQVYIEGSLRTRKWTDKQGNDKYVTEIVAHNMQMLGTRDEPQAEPERAPAPRPAPAPKPAKVDHGRMDELDDDIPF